MADNTESTIEQGGTEETVGLMVPDITEDEGANGTTDITPSNVPAIPLRDVHGYKPGEDVYPFLPQVPILVTVTARTSHAVQDSPRRQPQLHISLEHGPFKWTIDKFYRDVLSLRRDLLPLRDKIRQRGRRETLPPLLKMEDINMRQATRLRKQVPKVQTFLNAVMSNRKFRKHPATARFLEVSRISFIRDTGEKKKEGLLTKRSGGHRKAADCFGITACFICRCSSWRERWFVLKDSYLVSIRSHHSKKARRTISGVTLFDTGMTVTYGLAHTGIQHGIQISTQSRELLMRAHSRRSMNAWVAAIQGVMESTGKIWVDTKPHYSFAPERSNTVAKWYVDGEGYMSDVADAIMAAKDEIFITDWQMSPHIYLKRKGSYKQREEWRLDNLLLKKAKEGVRVFIITFKEIELAIQLGSEFAQRTLSHPNVVFLRHPDLLTSGVFLWSHHEKLVIVDQSLAFVGGIDLAFGRWDNECHSISDDFPAPTPPEQPHISELASSAVTSLQQFFISSLLEEKVSNGVAEALRLRIARAYRDKQNFRVIVVMPLLPSYPADNFGESGSALLEAVTHWNYRTICRGDHSLFGRLEHEDGIPADEIKNYISFYGLRTHGEIGGKPETEIVYVHSKLMIVDDRISIIGSANVNDRSMVGERDSEVAIRYEDKELVDGTMNGEPYKVGRFSHSLRVHIFKEHLGLLDIQQKEGCQPPPINVEDPACEGFYINTWMKTAHKNCVLYEEIFGGKIVPTDKARNYGALKEHRKDGGLVQSDVGKAREAIALIQGNVVELPLDFLEKEDLTPNLTYILNFAPNSLFT